jgi:hypothetical protein
MILWQVVLIWGGFLILPQTQCFLRVMIKPGNDGNFVFYFVKVSTFSCIFDNIKKKVAKDSLGSLQNLLQSSFLPWGELV